jgi:aspartate carbamoyltransferase catalytic subunit
MNNSLYQTHILSMRDLSKQDIELVLHTAHYFKTHRTLIPYLRGKLLASLFFEPSTRTKLSFESAMHRLSGNVIGMADGKVSSCAKGESLHDAIKVISSYADAIVLRHPCEGAARLAAEASLVPIINGGDGSNEHPSQTLLDLFSIQECQNTLNGLKIAFAGDLKHSRTVHSLALAAAHYHPRMYFISPDSLMLPDSICQQLKTQGIQYSFHFSLEELIPKLDILYMTRIQKERFQDLRHYELIKDIFILKADMLKTAKPTFKVLAPLPRVNEIEVKIDSTPYAYYFQQAANGICVRQALLSLLLKEHPITKIEPHELERIYTTYSSH